MLWVGDFSLVCLGFDGFAVVVLGCCWGLDCLFLKDLLFYGVMLA